MNEANNSSCFSFLLQVTSYLLNPLFCMKIIGMLLPMHQGWVKKTILFFGCSMLTEMIIFVGDMVNLPPTILLFSVAVFISCDGLFLQKLTVALMLSSTAFAFNALVDSYIYISYYVPRFAFWMPLYFLMKRYAPSKDYELSSALWKLLLLLTMTPLGIVLSLVLLETPHYESDTSISKIVLLVIGILSFVGLLWTITVLARQWQMEQEHYLYEMNQSYYKSMEQQQFEVRRLRHDMANHLQILSSLSENEKNEYLKELVQNPVMNRTLHYCENQVINAVINAKTNRMEQQYITFSHHIEVADNNLMEKTDLCVLFANSLDNAIDACLKLPIEQRKIELDARADKGLLVLHMKNPINKQIKIKNEIPNTTKKDTNLHGYGLRSIKEIVSRYHGNMKIKTDDNKFSLFLYLMIHERT